MENEEKKNTTNVPNSEHTTPKNHDNNFSNNRTNAPHNHKPNNHQNNKPNMRSESENKSQKPKKENGAFNEATRSGMKVKNKNSTGSNIQNSNRSGNKEKKADMRPRRENEKRFENRENRDNRGGNKNERRQPTNGGTRSTQKTDGRKDTYVYILDGNIYINLTNRCSNGCDFCVRNERTSYYGNYLWLTREPSSLEVISAINGLGELNSYKEVVFCGFGEPTYKVTEMLAVCDYAHEKGLKTRLNTNGQGNLINKRDIVPELKGKIDLVNVSLNAETDEKYRKICRSMFRDQAYPALIDFARSCKRNGIAARFSVVDCIGEESVDACKSVAANVGIPLYVRKYIVDC